MAGEIEGMSETLSARRQAILVLGMHRSGTSALTRVLGLCGAALPERLMDAAPEVNERGFWEPREIVALHEEALEAAGSVWHDIRPLPGPWFESAAAAAFRQRLAALLDEEFGTAALPVVKDPRLCRLLNLWLPVLGTLDIAPCVVIPVRNPLEVAASLRQREGFGAAKWLMLWLGHFLAAERESRGLPRCFVTYEQILTDWRSVVERIGAVLGIAWPRAPGAAAPEIEAFLSGALRHHARSDDALDDTVPVWIRDVYDWALAACRGAEPDGAALDRIGAEMAGTMAAFGPVIGELDGEIERKSAELRRWIDVAVERYALIEQLQTVAATRETARPTGTLQAMLHRLRGKS